MNSRACARPFCPTVASSTSSTSCGAPVDLARRDAADLVELGHQVDARVQPAGGVDEDDVAAARLAGGDRVEHHRRRIGAGCAP